MPTPSSSFRTSSVQWTPARRVLVALGAAVIFATWLYIVLVRPADWENVTSTREGLLTLGGYAVGTILLLAAVLPALPARTIGLIPVAMVINSVVGQVVGSVGVPLYLDSIGTVLVAALAGPVAGMATGALNNVVWSLLTPAALPFAAGAALIGYLSGEFIHRMRAFRNAGFGVLWGAILGIIGGMVAAPVAAFVYGGTSGVGTGAVVWLFREMGASLLQSVTFQSFVSDPLDKIIVMLVVYWALKALPKRTVRSFAPLDDAPQK